MKILFVAVLFMINAFSAQSQSIAKKSIAVKKIQGNIKIDGDLNDIGWKDAAHADNFIQLQPTPFLKESIGNRSEVNFVYNDDGVYVGGYMHETIKDSIASELTGRDGFGNNDFIGVILDTYEDKLNGFEYFLTPLNEQMDAKVSPGNGEDFSWNAVWESAVKIHSDGWSFEMFIPYSAIRFGKKKTQDWGLNIVRQRRKSGQKLLWQPIDPNVNGFLTQEGLITGFENIKPPVRLQLSPYFSTYYNNDGNAPVGTKKTQSLVNGGMDVKYGINQAFTLDMTLIPDFGQVQSDRVSLNLSPFEQRFSENRAFFTEGTEFFSKGDLFYSRRIGGEPIHFGDAYDQLSPNEKVISNPGKSKLINATKISGRTQRGLGIGILNAVTKPQYAIIEDSAKNIRKFETDPLTNYNVFVLDQTLKNNSSVSFVNTSVLRSGSDYDADVAAALFDFNDKTNTWNIGGKVTVSNIIEAKGKTETGYAHNIYFGKRSGRFNFRIYQDLTNDKYNNGDLGYFTNNNELEHGGRAGYNWNKPKAWYNRMNLGMNVFYSRLLKPLDILQRKEMMYQNAGVNYRMNAQTKKLQDVGFNISYRFAGNDFYEAREAGRVFRNGGSVGFSSYYESNNAKKLSWSTNVSTRYGGAFERIFFNYSFGGKIRFNSKFSVEENISSRVTKNDAGFAAKTGNYIIFSRRSVNSIDNNLDLKYNFNNKMGLTFSAAHIFTKVEPVQFYQLDLKGDLQPDATYTVNRNQNYNYLSADLLYNWQFAQGSFITLAWKDIGSNFSRSFEKNYYRNLGNTISGNQFTSFSLRVIYFLDYVTFRNKIKSKKNA